MNEAKLTHPRPEQLKAFGLGQLDQVQRDEVERHVAECDVCNAVLESLPDDTLVSLLKDTPSNPGGPDPAETLPSGSSPPVPTEGTAAFTPGDATAGTGGPPAGQSDTVAVPGPLREHPRYQVQG